MSKQPSRGSAKVVVVVGLALVLGLALVVGSGAFLYLNRDKLNFSKKDQPIEDSESESPAPPPAPAANPGLIPVKQLDSLAAAVARRPLVASAPIHADARTFRSYTTREDVLVLVDYYADWCGPCRAVAPLLSQLAATHGDKVVVLKVDVDREHDLATTAGVRSIPDVRLLYKGKQLEQGVGGRPYSYYEGIVLKHAGSLPAAALTAAPTASPVPAARPAPAPAPAPAPVTKPASTPTPTLPSGTITPIEKDWLPPGVTPIGS